MKHSQTKQVTFGEFLQTVLVPLAGEYKEQHGCAISGRTADQEFLMAFTEIITFHQVQCSTI